MNIVNYFLNNPLVLVFGVLVSAGLTYLWRAYINFKWPFHKI